jgi:hypothetical protein
MKNNSKLLHFFENHRIDLNIKKSTTAKIYHFFIYCFFTKKLINKATLAHPFVHIYISKDQVPCQSM